MSYYLDLLWRELDPHKRRESQKRGPSEHQSNQDSSCNAEKHHLNYGPLLSVSRSHRYKHPWSECNAEHSRFSGHNRHRCPYFHCCCQRPSSKRRKAEVKAVREQLSSQEKCIEELQKKVHVLETEHTTTKKKLQKVRMELRMIRQKCSRATREGTSLEGTPLSSRGAHEGMSLDGTPLSFWGTREGVSLDGTPVSSRSRASVEVSSQLEPARQSDFTASDGPSAELPDSQNIEVDKQIEVIDCSADTPQQPQSPVYRCPQMLTPISHTFCSTLQMLENLASSSSHPASNSRSIKNASSFRSPNSPSSGQVTVNPIHKQRAPRAKPFCALRPGTKVLSSSLIDKSSLFTVKQVLAMFEGQNIATVAAKLAELAVFGRDVLKKCTPRGQGKYPALPQEELFLIKQVILDNTPAIWSDLDSFERIWQHNCVSRIAGTCSDCRRHP